jgi:hypothetical protein
MVLIPFLLWGLGSLEIVELEIVELRIIACELRVHAFKHLMRYGE